MTVRRFHLLSTLVVSIAVGIPSLSSASSTLPTPRLSGTSTAMRTPSSVHFCARPGQTGCVDIIKALNEFDKECMAGKQPNEGCYDDLRDQVRAFRKRTHKLEAEIAHLKMQLRGSYRVPHRSRQEIDHANQTFNREFGSLRKLPQAFQLARELVLARMRDPTYRSVSLDTIVRNVATSVSQVIDAEQQAAQAGDQRQIDQLSAEVLAARTEAGKADAAAARAIGAEQQALAAATDSAERARADDDATALIGALGMVNNAQAAERQRAAAAIHPSVRCTSRKIGYTVQTDCQ